MANLVTEPEPRASDSAQQAGRFSDGSNNAHMRCVVELVWLLAFEEIERPIAAFETLGQQPVHEKQSGCRL